MNILNLKALFSKLFKRPKILISITIAAIVLCLAVSKFFLSAYYVARAKILVTTDIIGEGGVEEELLLSDRVLNTTVQLLKSRDFIKGVVKELNLEGAFGKFDAVEKLLPMVNISPLKGTDIIEISVKNKKAELATLIANAMSKVVITHSNQARFSFEKDLVSWIAEKSSGVRGELEKTRSRIQEFKESVGAADVGAEYDSTLQRLLTLQGNLNLVRADKEKFELAYVSIENFLKSGKKLEELTPVVGDYDFKTMQSEYGKNETMMEELLKKYQPGHPKVTELAEELSRLEASLDSRAKEIINGIEADYKTAKAQEEELQKVADTENKKVLSLEGKVNEYKLLQEDLEEKETIFNTFLEKVKEESMGGLRIQQLSLAEQAYLPQRKEGPSAPPVIFVGLLIGIAASTVYNILKDNGAGFIEKRKAPSVVPPLNERRESPPPKSKGMYIERVKEEDKEG